MRPATNRRWRLSPPRPCRSRRHPEHRFRTATRASPVRIRTGEARVRHPTAAGRGRRQTALCARSPGVPASGTSSPSAATGPHRGGAGGRGCCGSSAPTRRCHPRHSKRVRRTRRQHRRRVGAPAIARVKPGHADPAAGRAGALGVSRRAVGSVCPGAGCPALVQCRSSLPGGCRVRAPSADPGSQGVPWVPGFRQEARSSLRGEGPVRWR